MISILKKLSKAPLFDGMSTADIELLVNCLHMYQKEYGPGEYIHYQNDTYNSIGLIVSGEVHMIGEDFWGNRNLIHVFDELQFYGEAHSMTQKPMFFNIVAIKKSVVLFINTTRIITTCTHACGAHQKLI
ncbi:MAG: cyclic nucleotide-binding domain-containing protein, partial [Eubacterium sp.]